MAGTEPGTLRSSAGVGAAVMTSRVLGLLREGLQSALFGVSALTDAYSVAFRIPNLLRDLFAEGALSSAFVPTFAEALARDGRARAHQLGNLVVTGLLLATGLLTVLGVIYAGPLVALISDGFDGNAAKLADATRLCQVMMPILMFISVSAAWMGMLNAQQKFAAPAFAPALFNVTSIVCGLTLLGLQLPDDHRAILIWAGGTTVAGLVQALVLLPSLWRLGYRPRLALGALWRDPDVRRIARLMAPATIGLAAIQLNVFVNTRFAAGLGDGPPTNLQNAFRLFYLPVGLFGVALATVTTARTAADAVRGDRAGLVARVVEGTRAVWLLALPSAIGLIALAEPVVALLFERRRFLPADTAATVPVVQAYMLGVLPYCLVKVVSPAFFALGRPGVPMLASLAAVAVNLLVNQLVHQSLGASGLALGTSLAALVNLAVLRLAFARVVGGTAPGPGLRPALALAAAAAALAGVALAGARVSVALVAGLRPRLPGAVTPVRALLLFGIIAVAFSVYVTVLRLLRHPDADELWQLPARVLRKLRPARSG